MSSRRGNLRVFRFLSPPEHAVLSLGVQAAMPEEVPEKRSQFRLLLRHFLERFFNNELASADGDAKARLIQIACAVGLPGFILAIYLYPSYHDVRAARPYWAQVNDHYFYVVYSLVAMGVVTVFEWDLFFPDLLDVFVLSSLPVRNRDLFLARISAAGVFLAGFLVNSNVLAMLVLPAAMDPPHLFRFVVAHLVAVSASGVFAASSLLATQGLLLGLLGERLFRKISLVLQGISITGLFAILLLWPALSVSLEGFLRSGSRFVMGFPPFWFLGIYQRLMEGPAALPIFATLARIGFAATLLMSMLAVGFYPLAYWRRTRQLIEGSQSRETHRWFSNPIGRLLNAAVRGNPARSAIFHFIGQTLLRVQRHRIYLVMYGGLGIALLIASVLRLSVADGKIIVGLSPNGLRIAVPIVAFWTIAGLHMAFVSPTSQSGKWVFRVVLGKPGIEPLNAARFWVLLWGLVLTVGTVGLAHAVAPPELRGWETTCIQLLVAVGLCFFLTDAFFLGVTTIPFTGVRATGATMNLALVLIRFFGLFPPIILATLALEDWLESDWRHVAVAVVVIPALHLEVLRRLRKSVAENAILRELDDDEEEFPQRLSLRY